MSDFLIHWLSRHSLKFKLNISILTLVFVVFLGLAFLISAYSEPILKAQLNDNAKKSIDTYVTDFSRLALDTEQVILNTKNTLTQMKEDNIDAIRVLLNSAIKTVIHSDLDFINAWLYIFPPENVASGELYISYDYDKGDNIDFRVEHIDNLYDRFSWFKEVPKKEQIYWSEPYQDKETGRTVFTCLIPFKFYSQTDFNGLLALTVDLTNIQNRITDFSFYETGKLILLTRTGLYVTYPDPDVALKLTIFELAEQLNLPQLKAIGNDLAKGRGGQISIPDSPVFNDTAVFFYAPISHIGWSFLLVYGQHEFLKPLKKFQFIIAFALLGSLFLLTFIINLICHHSTKQLRELSAISDQYGHGNFKPLFQRLPTSSEIGLLAGALSSMRTNLLDYINKERNLASETQKRQSELDIAKQIQKSALSTKYPENKSFKIATLMAPAQEVGGDFYDFFFIDKNKFAIVVADVSGKGIPAALYMMKALTLIKNISRSKKSLDFVFNHVNEQLCEGNNTCMFVTAFMAVINLSNGMTKYINAGHNPPLRGNSKGYNFLKPHRNIVLGINADAKFVEEKMQLSSGDHLFLYTDGITEAKNVKSKFYGEDRLLNVMRKAKDNPQDNINIVFKDVRKFSKNASQSDDITMLDFVFLGNRTKSFTVKADITKLEYVLNKLKADMIKHNASETAIFNMVMAAEEMFSNIALYAYDNKDGKVNICIEQIKNMYYIKFIDSGKKYNPLKNENPDISSDIKDRNVGGLGIFLAKRYSDTMTYSYKNGNNILKIGIVLDK